MAFIMCEPPAPCLLNCEYCYIPRKLKAKLGSDRTFVTTDDFVRLGERFGEGPHVFWFCASGEPMLRHDLLDAAYDLAEKGHRVVFVTGFGGEEVVLHKNVGYYWSMHFSEYERLGILGRVSLGVHLLSTEETRVWPTMVMHESEMPYLDVALRICQDFGWKLIPTRYREGQGDLADVDYKELDDRLRADERVDMRLWDYTPNCWHVSGGRCYSGKELLIVDNHWRIGCCHGDGNMHFWGKFPGDIEKVPGDSTRHCKSTVCPCKHMVMWGCNSKFDYTFNDILEGWDDWCGTTSNS